MSQPSARGWHHEEDTVTVPLVRPQRFMLRQAARARTLPSIDVEEATEDWDQRTNELPRRGDTESITHPKPPQRSLPPVPRPPSAPPARSLRGPSAPPPRPGRLPPLSAPPRPASAPPRPVSSLPPPPVLPPRAKLSSLPPVPRVPEPSRGALPPIPAFVRSSAPEPELPEVEVNELLLVEQTESVEPIPAPSVVVHDELVSDPRALERALPTEPASHRHEAFAPGWGPPPEIPPARLEMPLEPAESTMTSTRDWLLDAVRNSRRVARRRPWLAVLAAVLAVGMVALIFSALVSRVADARLAARTRMVTASDLAGAPLAQATVFVDGVAKCSALPCELDLEDGAHWISLRADGYQSPPVHPITAGDGSPRHIHFQLRHEAAPLPPPPALAPAPAPTPVAEVAALPSAEPAPLPPVAEEPAPKPVAKPTPRPAYVSVARARLNINSIPVSNVVLDGRPLGTTPKLGVAVAPGAHTIVFISGKKRLVRGAMARAGKTSVVSARF